MRSREEFLAKHDIIVNCVLQDTDAPLTFLTNHVRYYGVDHSPSYLWNSATWEISEALLPHLRSVLTGARDSSEIIRRAIEIRDGTILNPRILSFQHRSSEYPHAHV